MDYAGQTVPVIDRDTGKVRAACERAHKLRMTSFKSIESMLLNNLDCAPLAEQATSRQMPLLHDNIRGPESYS
ncbi:MAG: hypothetical protein GEV05_25530 [Betaproteobacteria bacterium]|nr:hypothetical protein [Betaproteobacteria bacterium]